MDNIDTVTAIYQAVRFGEPLMSRIVTVTGDAVQNPCNFEVPVGMLLSELLEQAGGLKNEAVKIICGRPDDGKSPVYNGCSCYQDNICTDLPYGG